MCPGMRMIGINFQMRGSMNQKPSKALLGCLGWFAADFFRCVSGSYFVRERSARRVPQEILSHLLPSLSPKVEVIDSENPPKTNPESALCIAYLFPSLCCLVSLKYYRFYKSIRSLCCLFGSRHIRPFNFGRPRVNYHWLS